MVGTEAALTQEGPPYPGKEAQKPNLVDSADGSTRGPLESYSITGPKVQESQSHLRTWMMPESASAFFTEL
ncbi:hypothetical protein COLO4_03019 [Corchorus olitorius]|uniref:Uncharacterized protein n=1 Tax=Corchorus olitorius TaxID=93759 RepID=A0A1R3KZN9_9ROSI|nr:hypothetical protein COLO4_03019 [Corchorus olitorius]